MAAESAHDEQASERENKTGYEPEPRQHDPAALNFGRQFVELGKLGALRGHSVEKFLAPRISRRQRATTAFAEAGVVVVIGVAARAEDQRLR